MNLRLKNDITDLKEKYENKIQRQQEKYEAQIKELKEKQESKNYCLYTQLKNAENRLSYCYFLIIIGLICGCALIFYLRKKSQNHILKRIH